MRPARGGSDPKRDGTERAVKRVRRDELGVSDSLAPGVPNPAPEPKEPHGQPVRRVSAGET